MSVQTTAPDGAIDRVMSRIFGRSWRTSAASLVPGVCAVVVVADQFIVNPILHVASGVCVALGLGGAALIGRNAKDAKVSGLAR